MSLIVVYLLIPTSNHNAVIVRPYSVYVVYLLIPTSNHNLGALSYSIEVLYIFWFLHQTTTSFYFKYLHSLLYIFWFLHQTTTYTDTRPPKNGCISFDSYIKPQLASRWSTHVWVVYLLIPTSNHNLWRSYSIWALLYIFWFLHQTTTGNGRITAKYCCISFDSYIKPQLSEGFWAYPLVVYLLIPTSNHNLSSYQYYSSLLYIFWFLHQTTTAR